MRNLALALLLAPLAAAAAKPEKMHVVVRTADRVLVNYVCANGRGPNAENVVVGHRLQSVGEFAWHVVGGVAPYRVIKDETEAGGGGCITVMDATGQVAQGCGVVGLVTVEQRTDCSAWGRAKLDDGPYGLVPNDSTDLARSKRFDCRTYRPPVKLPDPVYAPRTGKQPAPAHRPQRATAEPGGGHVQGPLPDPRPAVNGPAPARPAVAPPPPPPAPPAAPGPARQAPGSLRPR